MSELLLSFEKIHLPTISQGTRTRYLLDIERRIRPKFGELRLDQIDRLILESFRSEMLKKLSPKSVNNCMDLLLLMLRKAVDWEMVEKVPLRIKKLKLPEAKYHWWDNKKDISTFLGFARRSRYFAAYKLALDCGLRRGEIVGLSKQDVDLERGRIHIHRQWLEAQRCYGPTKGRKQRFLNFESNPGLKEALTEAITRSPDPEIIFVTREGHRVRPGRLSSMHFPRLVRRAKVPLIRFHDLRHTFASWYMIEHDNIWALRELLGHADIQTTQRYAHLSSLHRNNQSLSWGLGT